MAALLTPAAVLLCVPLPLYRVAPFSLAWLTDARASVAPTGPFNLDPLAIGGLAALIVAAATSARGRTVTE